MSTVDEIEAGNEYRERRRLAENEDKRLNGSLDRPTVLAWGICSICLSRKLVGTVCCYGLSGKNGTPIWPDKHLPW